MTSKIQKVETEIMDCWRVVDDIDLLFKYFGDDEFFIGMKAHHADKIMNLMLGVKELYSVRFERLWRAYEESLTDYYEYEQEALRSRDTIDSLNANIEALTKDDTELFDDADDVYHRPIKERRLNDATPEEWDKVNFFN